MSIPFRRASKLLVATTAFFAFAGSASAACTGVTFAAAFAGSYRGNDLGTPTGVTPNLGGVTFLNNSTLLIGGGANGGAGYIASIGVTRDAQNHITGFTGPSSNYALAPNIDGGLAFGPSGVLFATTYADNKLLQYLPGAPTPSKTIDLSALGVVASVGTLQFVPNGFAGAGQFKLASYSGYQFYTGTLVADGSGTFNVSFTQTGMLSGGPEGLVYVKGSNAGFGGLDRLLVAEYQAGAVGAYQLDANGNPVSGSRVDFITGLSNAEGAVIDPLTGDFLFSTYGGGNRLLVVSGFAAPPTPGGVPEPATWALLIAGFGMTGAAMRRRATMALA